MKRLMFTLLAGLLLFAARSASAQSRDPYFTDFSANYDVVYHHPNLTSHAGAHFDLASTWKRDVPFIGPVLEVGFNHFKAVDATVLDFMGGLRIRPGNDHTILPFGQVLVGLYHQSSINDFALQGGGGLDFRSSGMPFRIRAQVDGRRVFHDNFNAVRFSLGIVLPLNR